MFLQHKWNWAGDIQNSCSHDHYCATEAPWPGSFKSPHVLALTMPLARTIDLNRSLLLLAALYEHNAKCRYGTLLQRMRPVYELLDS